MTVLDTASQVAAHEPTRKPRFDRWERLRRNREEFTRARIDRATWARLLLWDRAEKRHNRHRAICKSYCDICTRNREAIGKAQRDFANCTHDAIADYVPSGYNAKRIGWV